MSLAGNDFPALRRESAHSGSMSGPALCTVSVMAIQNGGHFRPQPSEQDLEGSHQGELRMTRQTRAASQAEAAAQAQLKELMERLKGVEKEMREIHKSLDTPEGALTGAAAGSEVDEEDEDENDISTEIR